LHCDESTLGGKSALNKKGKYHQLHQENFYQKIKINSPKKQINFLKSLEIKINFS